MEAINTPLLSNVGGNSKIDRNHHILNCSLLGCAMYFISYFGYVPISYRLNNIIQFLLLSLYLVVIFIVPMIIFKTGHKLAMLASLVILFITFIINVYIYSISIISVMLGPFAFDILEIAAGSYVMCFSDETNIGLNFGLFFGIPQIISGLACFTIDKVFENQTGYVVIFILFLIIAVLLVLFLGNPNCENLECLEFDTQENNSMIERIVEPVRLISDKHMIYLIPSIMLVGFLDTALGVSFNLVFYSGWLFSGYGNSIGIISFLTGLFTLIIGGLSDKIKRIRILYGLIIIGVISTILYTVLTYNTSLSYPSLANISFTITLFYSTFKYGILILVYSIMGLLFCKRSLSSNACIQLFKQIGEILIYIIITWMSSTFSFYVLIILLVLSCGSLFHFLKHHNY